MRPVNISWRNWQDRNSGQYGTFLSPKEEIVDKMKFDEYECMNK